MAPPKRSKAKTKQFKMIGEFSGNSKKINLMEAKLEEQKKKLRKFEKETNKAKCRLQRRKKKLLCMQELIRESRDTSLASFSRLSVKAQFILSSKKTAQRKKNQTNVETPHMAKTVRRNETYTACSLIHGSNEDSTAYGMINTLTSKYSSKALTKHVLSAKPSILNELKNQVLSGKEKQYYQSHENLLRSLNVYYSHCVMGKAKFLNIRKANKNN